MWGGEVRWVNLISENAVQIALSSQEQAKADVRMTYTGPLIAPVKAGQVIGTARVLVDGKTVSEVPLVTSEAVGSSESMWKKALDSALIMLFGA